MKFLLLMSLYLLGSARGAPSQLDEPPGSSIHQPSVQQFSGEPFSLATPSDREAFFDTSSGRDAFSKQAAFEHALVGRASGEHSSGKHPSGEPGVGEHAAGEHAAGEHAPGERPPGVQAAGEPPPGEQAPAEPAPAEPAPAEHTPAEHTPAEQAVTELAAKEQPSGEQPSGEQPSEEQPSGSPAATSAGGKLEFMVQGCENMCPSMSLFSHGTRMQLICCRDASFCNKT
ncbi:acrosomal protein SP-10 isoform X2 [Myotis daubentonii]|uniref:acrosomal protein SP-10 isoform X2 n=1 Tax=Myotis daubentonii TaxID=98922 RepID=UPI002873936B|nr:acrosomal protein SP-10 isoform X2 [Myotis daubentonii]